MVLYYRSGHLGGVSCSNMGVSKKCVESGE